MQRDEVVKEMVKSGDEGVERVVHDYLTEQGVEEYYIKQAIVACKLYRWMKQVYEKPCLSPTSTEGMLFLSFDNGDIRIRHVYNGDIDVTFKSKSTRYFVDGARERVKTSKRGLTNILIRSTSIARRIMSKNWELYEELAKV